jgi:hypothetical protein
LDTGIAASVLDVKALTQCPESDALDQLGAGWLIRLDEPAAGYRPPATA